MVRNKPLVSVVMSVFNADTSVNRAIESILNQTLQDFEFIIVNNGSNDRTSAVIRPYTSRDKRIRLVRNNLNLKLADSLNIGVSFAKADFIARMDSDDISLPKRLETQYLFLEKHPKVAVVGTNISIINKDGKKIWERKYPTKSKEIKKIMLRYAPFAHPSVMYRKKSFQEFGGYNPHLMLCEDIDFWFRIGTKYDFGNIPQSLLQYTLSNASGTHSKLQKTELMGFRIKIIAILRYGYRPSLYDIIYNLLQFLSLWFMPAGTRIKLYNALRSRMLI